MSDPYREPSSKYPWLSIRKIGERGVKFLMTNTRSDSWYGGDINKANKDYLNLIKSGDRVIDCGANEGFLAVLAALNAGAGGSVLALEPAPHNWEPLNINIALNGLEKRVHPQPWAVGDKTCKINFGGEAVSNGPDVECVRLDEFCWFGPDVIKIDVEGYEVKVLRGAREIIATHKPTIFLELHLSGDGGVDMRTYGDTPQELFDLIKEYGYRIVTPDGSEVAPENAPNGVVILRPVVPKSKIKPLIYTLAYGAEYFMQASLMVQSLREFGEYDGDLLVFTDQPGKITGALTIERPQVMPVPHMEKANIGLGPIHGNTTVAFLDSDLVVLRPIQPLLEFVVPPSSIGLPVEHPEVDNDPWFGGSTIGYNTGTIVAGAEKWHNTCRLWLKRMQEDHAEDLHGHDQPVMNNMIREGEMSVTPLPREWFYFFSTDSKPITRNTIIAHTKGYHRLESMRALHGLRKL